MLHLCLVMKSKRNSDFQIGSSSINCRATKLKKLIQLLYFTLLNMFLSKVYLHETSRVTNFFFHACLKVVFRLSFQACSPLGCLRNESTKCYNLTKNTKETRLTLFCRSNTKHTFYFDIFFLYTK